MQKKIEKIEKFLLKESKKRGFNSIVFGLSGGIDSAVVGYFCNKVFKKKARAFIMPSTFSNPKNTDDAINFAKSIGLYYEVIDIGKFQDDFASISHLKEDSKDLHRIGNFIARIRMAILYDKSYLHNALVIGTSNKSELMLGYGTLYGDMACAINPIGNIYKSEIFEIAKHIGIPKYIIDKKPSADLFEGQSDEYDLGYSYEMIDKLLVQIDSNLSKKHLLKKGFEREFIESIQNRIKNNRFKSKMPKIAKV
ncbi:NAD+ synthase [Helicobacter sp. MIT 99-5507]|uniref:NAD+ synthase n=1 Tax=Helicobacter sp. MIT 99-5507 TaxID=152489 RepID=UPI002162C34A|nr:NAD+ synthase [Helicobacter sp. MIT 99-5507]